MRVAVMFESQKAELTRVEQSPIASKSLDIAHVFRREFSSLQVAKANLRHFLISQLAQFVAATVRLV